MSDAKYWAFISYSHADERWATWLHRALETYKVPRPLVGTKGPDGVTVRPARLFPLFRDREELASASSLSAQIEGALQASRNLIVICSPRAARSRWVNEEIEVFKALGREGRIFCLIVDGEPAECFPEAVRSGEPIAADARPDKDGRRHALLKLLSGILDVGFDNLRLRDQERRMRLYAMTSAVLLGAVLVFAAITWYALAQKNTAEREARAARAALSGQTAMTSRISAAASLPRSLLLAVAALRVTADKQEPRVAAAEEALREALAEAGGTVFPGWEETAAVALSPDGRWLAASADGKSTRLWHLTTGGERSPAIELGGGGGPAGCSPDSRWLVTMNGEEGPAQLWDLAQKDPKARPHRWEQARGPAVFSADNRWLVTAGADRSVRLWRLDTIGPRAPLTLPPQPNRDAVLAVSPDSRWLVTSSWTSQANRGETDVARLWDLTAEHPEETGRALPGNTSSISHAVFSPDGHWLATASAEFDSHTFRRDKTVYLWDLTRKDIAAAPVLLQGHEGSITALAISPDSRRLATGSEDRTVRLWDLTAPAAPPAVLQPPHESAVAGLAFGPDSRWLVTVSSVARLWDLQAESLVPIVLDDRGVPVAVSKFVLSPSSRFVLLAAGATSYLLDLGSNPPTATVRVLRGHEGAVTAAAFGPEGRALATASQDETVRLWNLATARPAASPLDFAAEMDQRYIVTPDSRWMATIGGDDPTLRADQIVRLTDLRTPDSAARPIFLRGHEGPIFAVAFSPDGHWLATGSHDQTARLWRVGDPAAPPSPPIVLRGHTGAVSAVAFSRDGRRLATGSFDGTVRLWDLTRPGGPVSSPAFPTDGAVYGLEISADGRWLLERGGGAPRLWDLAARNPGASPRIFPDGDRAAFLSPDSRWLVISGNRQKQAAITTLWDLRAGDSAAAHRVLDAAGEPTAFSPDGRWLVTQGVQGAARLWPLTGVGPAAAPIELRSAARTAAFRPDSRQLVTADEDGAGRWWDLTAKDIGGSGRALPSRYGFSDGIAFSADGRRLLGFDSKGATLWEVQADGLAPEPVSLPTQDHHVWNASFTPDGRWLITTTHSPETVASVSLWPLRLEDLTSLACRTAGREVSRGEWQRYFAGQPFRKVCLPAAPTP